MSSSDHLNFGPCGRNVPGPIPGGASDPYN